MSESASISTCKSVLEKTSRTTGIRSRSGKSAVENRTDAKSSAPVVIRCFLVRKPARYLTGQTHVDGSGLRSHWHDRLSQCLRIRPAESDAFPTHPAEKPRYAQRVRKRSKPVRRCLKPGRTSATKMPPESARPGTGEPLRARTGNGDIHVDTTSRRYDRCEPILFSDKRLRSGRHARRRGGAAGAAGKGKHRAAQAGHRVKRRCR